MFWLKSNRLGFVAGRQEILALGNQYSGGAWHCFLSAYLSILEEGRVSSVCASLSCQEHPPGPVSPSKWSWVPGFFQELSEPLLI